MYYKKREINTDFRVPCGTAKFRSLELLNIMFQVCGKLLWSDTWDILFMTLQLGNFRGRKEPIRSPWPDELWPHLLCHCYAGGFLPRWEEAAHLLCVWMAIASALEISYKRGGILSSCTESPLGRRTPKPHTACLEPLLCWFSEAPKAVKFAQVCTYFLQRLTLGLHYHCRPLLNRHGRGKEREDSKGKAEESKRATREWCLRYSPGDEDVGNR